MTEGIHEKGSAKLRACERIARLCGFDYDTKRHPYGGFFNCYQAERIAIEIEGLIHEAELSKREAAASKDLIEAMKIKIETLERK